MEEKQNSWLRNLEASIVKTAFIAPWFLIIFLFRLLYGFRIENPQNLPKEGPFILALKEPSIAGIFSTGYLAIKVLLPQISKKPPTPMVAFMQDRLFEKNYINYANAVLKRYGWEGQLRALIPHAAGRMAFNLFEGLQVLKKGGCVFLNPEGNARWDGLPMTIGHSLAWLGLHSAAPIYPALCTVGAFDIWPTWRTRPYLSGNLFVRVGDPFKLTESPLDQVTQADLEVASQRIHDIYEIIAYGEGGVKAWAGAIRHKGKIIDNMVGLKKPQVLLPQDQWSFTIKNIKFSKRKVTLLLWRCPVCKTNDALVHHESWFRKSTVFCQSCRTKWILIRTPGHDFRMVVVEGDPDLIGLEMPLSVWYEKMKEDFKPEPIRFNDPFLKEGEQVYLHNDNISLLVHSPSYLMDDWQDGEAPATKPRGGPKYGKWEKTGKGRILVTGQRLVWLNQGRELYFNWSLVTAVVLWPPNTVGLNYGSARYQFPMGTEPGLKWLTYLGAFVKNTADKDGHEVSLSPH